MVTLDFTLQSSLERKEYIENLLQTQEIWSAKDLEAMADYLVFCMDKEERKRKQILTANNKKWQIIYKAPCLEHKHCNDDLTYVVKYSSKNTDTSDRKFLGSLSDKHHHKG